MATPQGRPERFLAYSTAGPQRDLGLALGALGASHNLCPVGCCPGRAPRPAAAGADSPHA